MSATDWELLQQYRRNQAETAFAELVRRHVNLVYSPRCAKMLGSRGTIESRWRGLELSCPPILLKFPASIVGTFAA